MKNISEAYTGNRYIQYTVLWLKGHSVFEHQSWISNWAKQLTTPELQGPQKLQNVWKNAPPQQNDNDKDLMAGLALFPDLEALSPNLVLITEISIWL